MRQMGGSHGHRGDAAGPLGRSGSAAGAERIPWAIQAAAAALCKRWKPAILWLLGTGHHRYNALAAHLPGVTPKVLTEQLKELVEDGLITRHEISGGAKHVEYALTPIGETLRPVLESLEAWGREYQRTRQKTQPAKVDSPRAAAESGFRQSRSSTGSVPHDAHAQIPRIDERRFGERRRDR